MAKWRLTVDFDDTEEYDLDYLTEAIEQVGGYVDTTEEIYGEED